MKKKMRFYCGVITLLLFAGCNEILENVDPPTSVPGEAVLTTEAGVNALRASMYSKIRASFGFTTAYFVGPGALADETRNRSGATRFQDLNTAVGTTGTAHLGTFGDTYNILLDTNLMIGAVEEGVLPAAILARYRGEAYAIRALAMHHLVRAFGYEPGMIPATAPDPSWDRGIIIRTEPTLVVEDADQRPRASVQETYAQILQDLAQAKTLLAGMNDDNTFITEAFVDGLTARVHLYAGNWADASAAAQTALANSGRSLVTTQAGVAGMFDEAQGGHPEALFKLVVNPDTEPIAGSNVNNGLAGYTFTQWVAQVPTQMVLDLYDVDDYRLAGWYHPCFNAQQGVPAPGCDAVNEPGWSTTKWNGGKGNMADDIPYMRVAELYLIRAEAEAKATGSPAAGAASLQELRDARNGGPIPASALANLNAFEDEILNERIRELIVEGHRFWDLKRLGRDVRNPDGSIKIRHDSHRILAQVPPGELSVNPQLVQNPGY